jgi:ribosomal protein L11 methyltransferase
MQYLEFKINCKEDFREILIAELAEVGFDSFLETDTGLDAYIEEKSFQRVSCQEVVNRYQDSADLEVV